jgi:hypothetical protein
MVGYLCSPNSLFAAPVFIGSAKVREISYFASLRRKKFSISALPCLLQLPVEALCKGKKIF